MRHFSKIVHKFQAFSAKALNKKTISYFSTKPYVVGTQMNRLNEMVLLSTHNICLNGWVRKYLHFYGPKFCLSKPVKSQIQCIKNQTRLSGFFEPLAVELWFYWMYKRAGLQWRIQRGFV